MQNQMWLCFLSLCSHYFVMLSCTVSLSDVCAKQEQCTAVLQITLTGVAEHGFVHFLFSVSFRNREGSERRAGKRQWNLLGSLHGKEYQAEGKSSDSSQTVPKGQSRILAISKIVSLRAWFICHVHHAAYRTEKQNAHAKALLNSLLAFGLKKVNA